MSKNWIEKAQNLKDANFRIYGLGNFDINDKEVAEILKLIDADDYVNLKLFYKKLHEKRMG